MGVPEGKEGPNPRDFIARLLQEVLNLEEKPLIDRAHWSLKQRPGPHDTPWPFVLRLHYYQTLEDIMRKAAAMKNIQYQGKKLQVFPNYPPTVAKRRALFTRTREILRGQPGVKYGLLYPVRLLVTYNSEQTSFTDPKKAQDFAEHFFGA